MKVKLFGKVNDSIVDGPGMRYAIFTQGCPHHCLGCHNPKSHDFDSGYFEEVDDILKEIDDNPLLDGVTLTGGEPFSQAKALVILAKKIKQRHLHLMAYSGYTYEEIIMLSHEAEELLGLCDILVDGKFIQSLRSLSLLYRGSSNQRIIDVKKSLKENRVVEHNFNEYGELVV